MIVSWTVRAGVALVEPGHGGQPVAAEHAGVRGRRQAPVAGAEPAQDVDLQIGRAGAVIGVVGEDRFRMGYAQLLVHLHERVGQRQRAGIAAAAATAMAGEQPLAVPQARQDDRHAQRQHHGREADPPAGRRELPGVRPPGLPLARPGVDDAAPQPHPLPALRGQQGEIPGDPQAEHHHLAEPPGIGDGRQRHAEQHEQREAGDRGPAQPHREQVGDGGDDPDPGRGQQRELVGGRHRRGESSPSPSSPAPPSAAGGRPRPGSVSASETTAARRTAH